MHLRIRLAADTTITGTWYTNKAKTTIKDLSSWTARMQFRPDRVSDLILLDLDTTAGGIVLAGSVEGNIKIIITDTDVVNIKPMRAEFDMVFLDTASEYKRPIRGTAEFIYFITPASIP